MCVCVCISFLPWRNPPSECCCEQRMDINNDGVLQCEEFVQMIRFLMLLGCILVPPNIPKPSFICVSREKEGNNAEALKISVTSCQSFHQLSLLPPRGWDELRLDFYPHHILKHLNLPTCLVSMAIGTPEKKRALFTKIIYRDVNELGVFQSHIYDYQQVNI